MYVYWGSLGHITARQFVERHEGFAIIHAIKWVAKLGEI
jgi:hypothetical protein